MPEGCLAPMYGKHDKEGFIIISAFCITVCTVYSETAAHVCLTIFTAGNVWGCVYLTFSMVL